MHANQLVRIDGTKDAANDAEEISDLYFAYGSNMNLQQIQLRCSRPQAVSAARLDGYELAFFGYTEAWDGAMETVEPKRGGTVWGVLFSLSRLNWERLDLWQDARMDGGGMYFHFPVTVTDVNGITHKVRLYKKDVLGEPLPPSCEYLDFIAQGAEQHHLPADYIAALRQRPAVRASYAVPTRADTDLGESAGISCRTCDTGTV
jgi:hypothetical protein